MPTTSPNRLNARATKNPTMTSAEPSFRAGDPPLAPLAVAMRERGWKAQGVPSESPSPALRPLGARVRAPVGWRISDAPGVPTPRTSVRGEAGEGFPVPSVRFTPLGERCGEDPGVVAAEDLAGLFGCKAMIEQALRQ